MKLDGIPEFAEDLANFDLAHDQLMSYRCTDRDNEGFAISPGIIGGVQRQAMKLAKKTVLNVVTQTAASHVPVIGPMLTGVLKLAEELFGSGGSVLAIEIFNAVPDSTLEVEERDDYHGSEDGTDLDELFEADTDEEADFGKFIIVEGSKSFGTYGTQIGYCLEIPGERERIWLGGIAPYYESREGGCYATFSYTSCDEDDLEDWDEEEEDDYDDNYLTNLIPIPAFG